MCWDFVNVLLLQGHILSVINMRLREFFLKINPKKTKLIRNANKLLLCSFLSGRVCDYYIVNTKFRLILGFFS